MSHYSRSRWYWSMLVGLEFAGGFVADFPFSLLGEKSRISIVAVTKL